MTREEAFKAWFKETRDPWVLWEAACRWQKEQIMDNISDALQSDLENGVKWLNEKASEGFSKKYPALLKVIKDLND